MYKTGCGGMRKYFPAIWEAMQKDYKFEAISLHLFFFKDLGCNSMVKHLLSLSEAHVQSLMPPSLSTPKGVYFVNSNVEYRIEGFFR